MSDIKICQEAFGLTVRDATKTLPKELSKAIKEAAKIRLLRDKENWKDCNSTAEKPAKKAWKE